MYCEKPPLKYCGFYGLPIHDGQYFKISDRLHECMDCHRQTEALIHKNAVLRLRKRIILFTKATRTMSENLIGDLRARLFRTIDGLEAGTISNETAAQITDVARAIIDSEGGK